MSIAISSDRSANTTLFHTETTSPRTRRATGARTTWKPASERQSFAIIGALKQALAGGAVGDSRLRRGERYAALTHTALSRRSPRLADDFALRLESRVMNLPKRERGERFTRATDTVMRELVSEGYLSKAEARAIRSEALRDTERLSNGVDHENKPRSNTAVHTSAPHSSIAATEKGPTIHVAAPSGFLWKPISDSDGLLAILLPIEWTADATKVEVLSPDGGTLLATGRPAGIGNGGRAHFRFDRTGGDFPAGSIVRVQRADGSVNEITISQPGIRNEGIRQR